MKVAISQAESYADAGKAVRDCLTHLGGIEKFVKANQKVLLKVNLLFGKDPKYAVNTHPKIVEAVIREIKKVGGLPFVGDSPALSSAINAAGPSGIKAICEQTNTPLIDLDQPEEIKFPEGKMIKSFNLSKKLKDFDLIINLPKMKTHVLCGMTLGVKNLYGCIAGKMKGVYHLRLQDSVRFSEMLLDLHALIQPRLTILDAVLAMEGQGPGSGEPINVGLVLASENALSLDVIAAKIAGFPDNEFPLIDLAKKRGLAAAELKNIEILGTPLSNLNLKKLKPANKQKTLLRYLPFKQQLSRALIAKPIVEAETCINCKKCDEICPTAAISIEKWGPLFDYEKCIRCYCCHEICPEKAISLKENIAAKLFSKII